MLLCQPFIFHHWICMSCIQASRKVFSLKWPADQTNSPSNVQIDIIAKQQR